MGTKIYKLGPLKFCSLVLDERWVSQIWHEFYWFKKKRKIG